MSEAPDDPLEDYLDVMSGANDETVDNVRFAVQKLRGWCDDEGINSVLNVEDNDVVRFLNYLHEDEGFAGSSIRTYAYALRGFYDEYTDGEGRMLPTVYDRNPARFDFTNYVDVSTKAEKQQHADNNEGVIYLDPNEVRKLRKHVPAPKVRNELAIKLQVQTGMRASELCRLTIDRFDRGGQRVTIEDTKNDRERVVAYQDLSPELELWLDRGRRDRFATAEDSPYIFVSRQRDRLTKSGLADVVRKAAKEAGIQEVWGQDSRGRNQYRVTPHALRSTFIYRCFDAGMSVPNVMELSGHTQLETVKKYANAARNDAVDALRSAEPDFGV